MSVEVDRGFSKMYYMFSNFVMTGFLILVGYTISDLVGALKSTSRSQARAQWAQVYWMRRAQLSQEQFVAEQAAEVLVSNQRLLDAFTRERERQAAAEFWRLERQNAKEEAKRKGHTPEP